MTSEYSAFTFDSYFRAPRSLRLSDEISLGEQNMAASESHETDWQLSKNSLKDRNKHMFNNSLISDVSFSVKDSSADQQRSLLIPTHKYVLAISSPVFFAMFYGQMSHTSRTVDLPDCDADSFMELLRFVYYDETKLTGSNVIQVLYLAKKYMIPALSEECTRFLHENLDADNVFAVLPSAQAYEEAGLVKKCWDVVDERSEEAMKSEAFLDVSHDFLKAVLERDSLRANEVEIFKAADRWVEHQCKKTGPEVTGDKKRQVLGDAIYLIRFPLMTDKEFAATVPETELLSKEEMCDIFLHFMGTKKSLHFSKVERQGSKRIHRVARFANVSHGGSWGYGLGACDALAFAASCDVSIHGVRLFGSPDGEYLVTVGIYHNGTKLTEEMGKFCTEKEMTNGYSGYDVIFKKPAAVKKNVKYEIRAFIEGPTSNAGSGYVTSAMAYDNTSFSFFQSKTCNNGTSPTGGQFPEILFTRR